MGEPDPKPLRWTRPARKHKIGRARAIEAMENAGSPVEVPASDGFDARVVWMGDDNRGVELEIVALDFDDEWLVIHVMPTAYRQR